MKLFILETPGDPSLIPTWLNQMLVGLELADLVSQLEAVHGAPKDRLNLDAVLGERRDDVLNSGLSALNADQITSLLTHPQLLLELQESVLIHGSSFWTSLQNQDNELTTAVNLGWQRLQTTLREREESESESIGGADVPATKTEDEQDRLDPWGKPIRRNNARSTLRLLTAACAVVLVAGVGLYYLQPSQSTGWGSPDALVHREKPAATFEALAAASNDYLKASRTTPAELQREISRFIRDCEKVQRLNLPELAAIAHPDRELPDSKIATYDDWLKVKCAAWAGKAQSTLAAMKEGNSDFETVDTAYTGILTKLKSALEKQAAALA